MLLSPQCDTWLTTLDEVADEVLELGGIGRPPIDALALAERLRIGVALDGGQSARGRLKQFDGHLSIFLKPDDRKERLQWATAHELGEVVAYRVFERLDCSPDEVDPRSREEVANLLASRILLPRQWFFADAEQVGYDLRQLKELYRTASHELIAWRLLDGDRPAIVTVFDQGRMTRRRSNYEGRSPSLSELERQCWRQAHETGRPTATANSELEVHAWPIRENGWTREILYAAPRENIEFQ